MANVVRALRIVQPAVLITISALAMSTAEIRKAWRRFRRRMRRLGIDYEDCYTIEPHLDGRGLHVHAFAYPAVSEAQVLAAAITVELGDQVNVRRLTGLDGPDYLFKRALNPVTLKHHVTLNGERLLSSSMGFWRDERGMPVPGGYSVLGKRHCR